MISYRTLGLGLGIVSGIGVAASCLADAAFSFDGDTVEQQFDTFAGTGVVSNPAAGQLDADEWSFFGFSDGTDGLNDLARGFDDNGVSQGGVYAFDIDNSTGVNTALGIQMTGADFTPGSATFRVQNNTGGTLERFDFSVDVFALNDQNRAINVHVGWSIDGTLPAFVATGNTTHAEDDPATWETLLSVNQTGLLANLDGGDYFYLHFSFDEFDEPNGSGSLDEFAIDNISITGHASAIVPTPSAALMGLACFAGLVLRPRRMR